MAKGHARPRGNNKWQLEVDLGSYIDPVTHETKRNRKYRTITAKNQGDADVKLARFVVEITGEDYHEPEKINFVDFINEHWMPKCATKRLAHTTLESYIEYLELRILPVFQYFRLDQIKPIHIIDFLDNLQEDGMRRDKIRNEKGEFVQKKGKLATSTIYHHYRILNNIFNFAVEIKLLKESPLEGVQKPPIEYGESDVYDDEEAYKLMQCLESETHVPHWQVIVKLAITTGMRRSELFGLEFKHIDLENGMIYVRQALTYSKRDGYKVHGIKKGNRNAKKRDIVISDSLIKPIQRLELQRKKERFACNDEDLWREGKYNFLLCDETGKPFNPTSLRNWWKRFLKRHDLKYIKIHALRHTSATLLINEGVHPKIISERLGHADIKTTMNVYGHALKKADTIATAKLDNVLFGNSETQ